VMPADVSRERALAIIAAYGAASYSWPADERAAVQELAIADPAVAAALAEARSLDALLAGWAGAAAPGTPIDIATLMPAQAARPLRHHRVWWAGAAAAAAVIALVLQLPPDSSTSVTAPAAVAVASIAHSTPALTAAGQSQAGADAEAFAAVFTPTADEDQLI